MQKQDYRHFYIDEKNQRPKKYSRFNKLQTICCRQLFRGNMEEISRTFAQNFSSSEEELEEFSLETSQNTSKSENDLANKNPTEFERQNRSFKRMATLRNILKQIPQFSGEFDDLKRFLRGVDFAIKSEDSAENPVSDDIKEKVINHVIVKQLDSKLYEKLKDKNSRTLTELEKVMKDELLKHILPEHVEKQIELCKQESNETMESYATRIKKLKEKHEDSLDTHAGTTFFDDLAPIKKYQERQIVENFIKGAKQELRFILQTQNFETLEDATNYALKKEIEIT